MTSINNLKVGKTYTFYTKKGTNDLVSPLWGKFFGTKYTGKLIDKRKEPSSAYNTTLYTAIFEQPIGSVSLDQDNQDENELVFKDIFSQVGGRSKTRKNNKKRKSTYRR